MCGVWSYWRKLYEKKNNIGVKRHAFCMRQAAFALIALRESGYPIDLGFLEECSGDISEKLWFDFADGRFTTFERCAQGERASLSTYHTLRKCAGLTYSENALQGGRKRALRLLRAYLSEKTEARLENLGELIRLYEE